MECLGKKKVSSIENKILKVLRSGNWGVYEIALLCKTRNLVKVQNVLDRLVKEGKIVKKGRYLYSLR